MKLYAPLYRSLGIRRVNQLNTPPMTPLAELTLPRKSVLHQYDPDLPFNDDHILFYSNPPQMVWVTNVLKLSDAANLGNPIEKNFVAERYLQSYFKENKKVKRLRSGVESVSNDAHLLVVNYDLVNRSYKYIKPLMAEYNEWYNFQMTFFNNVVETYERTGRQQFLIVDVPETIPSIRTLNWAEKPVDRTVLTRLKGKGSWLISDIWNWLMGHDDFGIFATIPKKSLRGIDIIFSIGGKFTILNLAILYGFCHDYVGATTKAQYQPKQIAKRFLILMMNLNLARSVAATPDPDDEADTEIIQGVAKKVDTKAEDSALDEFIDKAKYKDKNLDAVNEILEDEKEAEAGESMLQDGEYSFDSEEADKEIDKLLEGMDDFEVVDLDENFDEPEDQETVESDGYYQTYQASYPSLDEGVTDLAKGYVSRGRLSAAEYGRLEKIAGSYRKLDNPFGDGKLVDMLTITDEERYIDDKTPIAENTSGVIDDTMRSSSLIKLDRQYTEKVMNKDIVGMTMQLQKIGIAVQNYQVEEVSDFNNDYVIHKINVVPVVGKPSRIVVKFPKVDSKGQFKADGVTYRMRKQRGDVPIRKVGPDEVSLTSYYSKLFVRRSERVKFNFTKWVGNVLVARGIDSDDPSVTDIKLNDVFTPEVKLPRHYTAISHRISGFTSGDWVFSFNYTNIEKNLGVPMKDLAGKTTIPVGKFKGDVCWMSFDNQIMVEKEGKLVAVGTILDIIDQQYPSLPSIQEKKPIDIAELIIFGKPIPLGLVLAYYMGLGNLLKTIKAKTIQRKKGEARIQLEPNQFSLEFKDMELIVDGTNPIAAMLLHGFNRYATNLKKYALHSFDSKDVYGNLFELNGITPRYVREFDTMRSLWVDPITSDLLTQMKEPTDFVMLLMRAGELLLTDEHPKLMSGEFMRDKGYERFAGIFYGELVKAARQYQAKPRTQHADITMNPESVWYGITQDQTTLPVSDSNPIHSLKEKEVVVYRGAGGRSARSMTTKNRKFDKTHMGVVSESSPDNSDVGTVIYLTADPNYTSIRGLSKPLTEMNNTKLMSTSMLMSPGATHDD